MTVIGLVGPFGSGCSTVAKIIKGKGYNLLSLSNILKEKYEIEHPSEKYKRADLQQYGNEMRKKYGSDYLAKEISKQINKQESYIIDSIRNPAEVKYLKETFSNFFLFGIFAEKEIRWERVKDKYENNLKEFENDDKKDSGLGEDVFGQLVTETFRMSDIIILNNENYCDGGTKRKQFNEKINEKIEIINRIIPFRPSPDESFMTIAYAASMRSSCLKRKVGATIIDDCGNIISSGYNEVPMAQADCLNEYGCCYRDKLKSEFRAEINSCIKEETLQSEVYKIFKRKFKILDYCRALHAEENAIVNLARIGSGKTSRLTIYSTTFPCNLCANKIVQVGIGTVVYFEPYPMKEAKEILSKQKIALRPFEGVTFNGYFRLMEEISL